MPPTKIDLNDLQHDLSGHTINVINYSMKDKKEESSKQTVSSFIDKTLGRPNSHSACCDIPGIQGVWIIRTKSNHLNAPNQRPFHVIVQHPDDALNYYDDMIMETEDEYEGLVHYAEGNEYGMTHPIDWANFQIKNVVDKLPFSAAAGTIMAEWIFESDINFENAGIKNTPFMMPRGVLVTANGTYHAKTRHADLYSIRNIVYMTHIGKLPGSVDYHNPYSSFGTNRRIDGLKTIVSKSAMKSGGMPGDIDVKFFEHVEGMNCLDCQEVAYDPDYIVGQLRGLM